MREEEVLRDGLPTPPEPDTYDGEGRAFQQTEAPINVPLHSIFKNDDTDMALVAATLQGDEGALLNPSDSPPMHLPPRVDGSAASELRESHLRHAAQAQAALKNPHARGLIDPGTQSKMQEILKGAEALPAPDVTTFIKGRKVVIDGDVISTPNRLPKNESLSQLQRFLQDKSECSKDKKNADGSVIWCTCPTHRVARAAQSFGFRDKPLVWLSQQIAVLVAQKDTWKDLPKTTGYNELIDEDFHGQFSIPRALAQLISTTNVENILASMRGQCSLIEAFRHYTAKACDIAEDLRTPKEYTHQFDC